MTSTKDEHHVSVTSTNDGHNVTFLFHNGTGGIYDFYAVPQIVLVSILCLAIIVGNTCVLAAIRLSKNGRESRMNFFITHLALADLLVGVMVSLTDLATTITIEWYAGDALCKIIQFLQTLVTYSSTFMLVSLSIDRYDAVARPMNFSKSGNRGRFLVYAAWSISLLFALPALFIFRETVKEGRKQCWVDFPALWHWQLFFTVVAVVTFLLPAVIIAACYTAIIYIIWSKGRGHQPCCSTGGMIAHQGRATTSTRLTVIASNRGVIPQAKVRTIKMTLIIVIVFILCWSPYFLYNLLDIYEHLPYNNAIATLIQSAVPLNSAANPIIYGIFSTRVCKNLRLIPLPSCVHTLICWYEENRKCTRRGVRGQNNLTSQTMVDQTLTTYDAHRLNEVRLSPLKNRTSHGATKDVLDRRIFTDCGKDNFRQEDLKNLFESIQSERSSDKRGRDHEMTQLSRNYPQVNQGSCESEDSCMTDESFERPLSSERAIEANFTPSETSDIVIDKTI